MTEPTPDIVFDANGQDWRAFEEQREKSPRWSTFLDWMRTEGIVPEQVRRIEIYDLPHDRGVGFARTAEYTRGRRWGILLDPAREAPVTHTSTYLLTTLPPGMPTHSHNQ